MNCPICNIPLIIDNCECCLMCDNIKVGYLDHYTLNRNGLGDINHYLNFKFGKLIYYSRENLIELFMENSDYQIIENTSFQDFIDYYNRMIKLKAFL